jgi:hypothetical protein
VSRSVDHAPPQRGRIALASRRRVPSPGRLVIRRGDEVHDGVEASRRAWCDCDVQPAEMQASGGYSNQDSGATGKVMLELLAALAAHEARSGLSRLMRGTQKKFNHITARTYLRPRDMIQFCNSCLDEARRDDSQLIENEHIARARGAYSSALVERSRCSSPYKTGATLAIPSWRIGGLSARRSTARA